MRSSLSPDSRTLADKFAVPARIPDQSTCQSTLERQRLACEMVALLGWYGSDAFAYLIRKITTEYAGVSYLEIVRDVADKMNAQLPKNKQLVIARAASSEDLENTVIQIILGLAFQNKSTEEIASLLEESGVGKDAALEVATKYAYSGIAGISVTLLVQIMGKKSVQMVIERLIMALLMRILGKEAAG